MNLIAANPTAGISLGGGLRKLRIPRSGGGKSGGFRVIYLFADANMPIFHLALFAKNEKSNLTPKETRTLIALSRQVATTYRKQP